MMMMMMMIMAYVEVIMAFCGVVVVDDAVTVSFFLSTEAKLWSRTKV